MKIPIAGRKKKHWQRILAGLFVISCLTALFSLFMLKKGISFESFSVGPVAISNFSLIWKKKLEIQVDTVTLQKQHEKKKTSNISKNVSRSLKAIHFLTRLFSTIAVNEIRIGQFTGTLYLNEATDKQPQTFSLTSRDLSIHSNLSLQQHTIVFDITEAFSKRFDTRATGQIRLDTEKRQFTGNLTADLVGSLPVAVSFNGNSKQISFVGQETGRIDTIVPLVDLFGLDHNIRRWITDYLKGSRYNLKTFKGILPWNNPRVLLDTLYAEVRVDNCEYTFAQGYEPIKTSSTDVVFNKGVLTITPHDATFYNQSGGSSWLDINFNDPEKILLTARIKTLARANDDILTLLKYYRIDIPFKQITGETEVDLALAITLNRFQVKANGSLQISDSVIEWEQEKYGVANAEIILDNSNIIIEHMIASSEKRFVAAISGTLDAGSDMGDLHIELRKFTYKIGESTLTLGESANKPIIKYHIRPDGHSLEATASSWKLDGLKFKVGPLTSTFSAKNLSGVLSPTMLTIPVGVSAEVSGSFSFKPQKAELHCNLLHYKVKNLVLKSRAIPITVQYDQGLSLQTKAISNWTMNKTPTTFYPSKASYSDNTLTVINSRLSYGIFFDSHVSGQYNSLNKQGSFLLTALKIREKHVGNLLVPGSGIPVEINGQKEKLVIKIPELDLSISSGKNKNWSATFNDIATIHQRSALLQKYSIDAGRVTISSEDGKKPYIFSADIPYSYPILVKDHKPVGRLSIQGKITDKGFQGTVNKDLSIQYTDHLSVTSNNIGYNVPAIIKVIKELAKSVTPDSSQNGNITATCEAHNSTLFLNPDRQALADRIYLEYDGDRSTINLEHDKGTLNLELKGDQFTLVGKELNDVFMGSLVQGSDFSGGRMTMAAKGSFDHFSLLIKVEDTVLKGLKPLNNMLAFLNTVPALITFSHPEYSTQGLPVSSAVVGMKVRKGLATIDSFDVKSPVLTVTGTGWVNVSQNLMDMDFNMITQAKTNVRRIPLLGYVLAGKEKRPSITLKVHGNLQNPKVENSMFREVATMPFSLLYRTLTLPYHMVESMADNGEVIQEKNADASPGAPK